MQVLDANLTGFFGSLPGGPLGFALGTQFRDESLAAAYDPITQGDGFAFLIGNSDHSGKTDVYAAYGEVLLPVAAWLEVTGALRYEDYGGGVGDTLDPKMSLFVAPAPNLSLRASIGTSFRAPSTFQTQGVQTNFVNILDYDGSRTFAGRRTLGDPNLQPETSTEFNVGGTWRPWSNVELSLDYWDYAFQDVLRKDNAQGIVNADPFDPRVQRTAAGTVAIVNVAFINAGAPNQKFKVNLGAGWERGPFSLNLLMRHIGGYKDDRAVGIDAFTTLDANLSFDLSGLFRKWPATSIRLGAVNLNDADPPYVNVAGSYDPRSADPRGRRAFIRLESRFGGG